jgi:hypothetical protein
MNTQKTLMKFLARIAVLMFLVLSFSPLVSAKSGGSGAGSGGSGQDTTSRERALDQITNTEKSWYPNVNDPGKGRPDIGLKVVPVPHTNKHPL